jgi:hypothetical protein
MKEFLMLFRSDPAVMAAFTPEKMASVMQQWQSWMGDLAARDQFVGTNRLFAEGKTVSPGNIITDGPFAEGKEIVGGYMLLKAASLDEAIEIAKGCPILQNNGRVEVRPVLPMDVNTAAAHTRYQDSEA